MVNDDKHWIQYRVEWRKTYTWMTDSMRTECTCYIPAIGKINNTDWNEGLREKILIFSSFIAGSQWEVPKIERWN